MHDDEDKEDCCFGAPGESPTGTLNHDGSRLGMGGEGGGGGPHYANPTGAPPVLPHIGAEDAILAEDGQRRDLPEMDPGGVGPNDYGFDDALSGDPNGPIP